MAEGYSTKDKNREASSSYRNLMGALELRVGENWSCVTRMMEGTPQSRVSWQFAEVCSLCAGGIWAGRFPEGELPSTACCTADGLEEAAAVAGWTLFNARNNVLGFDGVACYRMYPEDALDCRPVLAGKQVEGHTEFYRP